MGNTSSVMISMDADAVPAKKEIAALEKQIKKLENKQLPLITEFEELQKKVAQAKKAIADADKVLAAGKIDKVDHFQITTEASQSIETYSAKIEELRDKIEALDTPILTMQKRMESLKFTGSPDNSMAEVGEQAKKSLNGAAQAAGKVTKEVGKTKSSFKSVGSAVDNFGKRIASTFKSAFIFSVLYKGLNELKQKLSAMLSTNKQFTTSLNQVKNNLSVAFQPIYEVVMPAINALVQLLVKATAYIAAFVNAIFGKSLNSSISAAREMEKSIQAVNNGAKGSSAAEKELTNAIKEKQRQVKALQRENKQLQREYEAQKKAVEAQTDALEKQIKSLEKEIDALQKAEKAANKAASAQREAIQANIDLLKDKQDSLQKRYNAETKAIDKQIKGYQKEIKAIQKSQKAAEEAKKASQKFTASFDELSTLGTVEEVDPYDTEIEKIQEKIDTLQEEKEIKSEIYENDREAIQEQIDLLEKSKDAIKDVDFSASIEGYEEKITAIREKIDALNESLVENPQIEQNEILIEQLQEEIDLLQEKKDALQDASNAAKGFDASGITKFNKQLDDLKKKIETSPLYKWVINNKEQISEFCKVFGALTGIVGGAFGAFKLFSGILAALASPAGVIALIIGALALLITYGGNGKEVIDNLKQAFELFGEGLTALINGDFETFKKKFAEGFINLANAAISAAESIVRALQKALRWVLEKIGIFETSVPEDSPFYNFFNADWALKNWKSVNEEVSFPRIPIPALAQGAILPPNKPFYAMLGDQKNGTNLEAPASLIEEIMRGVLSEQQWNFNVTANGSLGALIRLLNLQFARENDRETAF